MEAVLLTPASYRAVERRDKEIEAMNAAIAEVSRLWDMEWEKPLDLMYAVVDATHVSLATVNLAYHRVRKEKQQAQKYSIRNGKKRKKSI